MPTPHESTAKSRPQRRKSDHEAGDCPGGCEDLLEIENRLLSGSARMDTIESSVDTIKNDVAEVLDILRLGKSFFRLAGYVGSFAKWAMAIGAPIAAIYVAWKGGKP